MTTILEDTPCSFPGICKRNDVPYIAGSSQFGGNYTVSVAIGKLSPVVEVGIRGIASTYGVDCAKNDDLFITDFVGKKCTYLMQQTTPYIYVSWYGK